MMTAAGILLIVYLFLIVPFLTGAIIDAVTGTSEKRILRAYVNGYIVMFAAFWCVAVSFLYRGCTLKKLSIVWITATIIMSVLSIFINRTTILQYIGNKKERKNIKDKKFFSTVIVVSILAIMFSILFVRPQMEQTVEIVATSVETNTAYIYQPYTGEQYLETQTEHIFSPYEMLYAIPAYVGKLHPAFMIKIIIPIFFLIFFMGCYWELGGYFFHDEKKQAIFLIFVEAIYYSPVYTDVETPVTGIFRSCWNGSVLLSCCILPFTLLQLLRFMDLVEKSRMNEQIQHSALQITGLLFSALLAAQLLNHKGWFYIILMIGIAIVRLIIRKGYERVTTLD